MEPLSAQIADFSSQLFGAGTQTNYDVMSPYIPLSIYQSAVVQLRLLQRGYKTVNADALNSLRQILGHFSKRWGNAGEFDPCSKFVTVLKLT